MTLKTNYADNFTRLKTSNMQTIIVNNRVFLGIVAFSVSFGLSLVPNWDFSKAFLTGTITVIATYIAAFSVDQRRKNFDMLILSSLRKRIKDSEGLKSRIVREIEQIEQHRNLLFTELNQLQNQITESRNQRDNIHRDLSNFIGQKKQLESDIFSIKSEIIGLEKSKVELNNSLTILANEKRRLESSCNVLRLETTQLQTKIDELQQDKQEIESNLTLLGRLKPQLEEKLYELRIHIQELETEINKQNQLLATAKKHQENIKNDLNSLDSQNIAQKNELQQMQEQVALLQDERDLLQNQVWELLQQAENLNQELLPNLIHEENEENLEAFPFAEFIESLKVTKSQDSIYQDLPPEWTNFLKHLPVHEIQVLKAIVEQDNSQAVIKQIAEENITMPNLLIDSINELANNTIGELIIETKTDTLEVYQEHITHVKKILSIFNTVSPNSTAFP